MGCCHSTSTRHPASAYNPRPSSSGSHSHHGESSQAISNNPASPLRTGESGPNQLAGSSRRRLRREPREQLNRPLRRHIWTSKRLWTRRQLDRERAEFFDTRVTGRPETWHAIRLAIETIEHDLGTAQTILNAAGVTLPTGDLASGAYDEIGNHYQLPEHCVSDPTNILSNSSDDVSSRDEDTVDLDGEAKALDLRREEKGKEVIRVDETITVQARLSDGRGPDVHVVLGKEQSVRFLARRIEEAAGMSGQSRVRVAYLGRILREGESLQAQGWKEGDVVNALVFG